MFDIEWYWNIEQSEATRLLPSFSLSLSLSLSLSFMQMEYDS